jgi:hypothetical protein
VNPNANDQAEGKYPGLTDIRAEATVVVSERKFRCLDHTRPSSGNEPHTYIPTPKPALVATFPEAP